jgi:benzoate-CoA ligase
MAGNISTLLDANLEAGRGDKTAVIAADVELSYAEIFARACRVGSRLRDLGVRREERVLLVLDDTPAFPAAFLGAARIGAVPIPGNFLARADDFGYFLDDSYARVAIVDAAFLGKLAPVIAARPGVELVVANGEATGGARSLDGWIADGDTSLDPVDGHPEDMAFWLYSSGSTGRPKGVVHSHADLWFTCEHYAAEVLETTDADVHLSTTKLFHAYGLGNGLSFPMWSGATAVYMDGRPTAARALEEIAAHRPTLLFSVPTLYSMMLADPGFDPAAFESVRLAISAAEPLPPETWRRFHRATGVEILDGIGSTEMLHIYCSNRPGTVRPGTSGTPVPGYELEIRESGELYVKGGSALSCYWHQRDKTRRSLRGEWFATGDRYHLDDSGCFAYEGRVDDMLKVGGLWVSPIAIENRLMEHAAVREAAVVGVEVDGLARIKAFVIAAAEVAADLDDALRDWCRAALQRYQYPHLIEYVDDFPRTATGKVQRFKLRERQGHP